MSGLRRPIPLFDGFGLIDSAPASCGLLDEVAALRWVHENIVAFGGNPER